MGAVSDAIDNVSVAHTTWRGHTTARVSFVAAKSAADAALVAANTADATAAHNISINEGKTTAIENGQDFFDGKITALGGSPTGVKAVIKSIFDTSKANLESVGATVAAAHPGLVTIKEGTAATVVTKTTEVSNAANDVSTNATAIVAAASDVEAKLVLFEASIDTEFPASALEVTREDPPANYP